MSTTKQKLAALTVKNILENIGKIQGQTRKPKSMGAILLGVGYSEGIANNPQIVTESAGFKEELKKLMKGRDIAKNHKINLEAKTPWEVRIDKEIPEKSLEALAESLGGKIGLLGKKSPDLKTRTVIFVLPNYRARETALNMLYKLTGEYAPEKVELNDKRPYEGLTEAELDKLIAEGEAEHSKIQPIETAPPPAPSGVVANVKELTGAAA